MPITNDEPIATTDDPRSFPLHTDGSPYRYALIHPGGAQLSVSDTVSNLVGVLIDGYDELPTTATVTTESCPQGLLNTF